MRLGVVTTSYPRSPGDPAGGFVRHLARALGEAGHAVEVVAMGRGAEGEDHPPVRWVRAGAGLFCGAGAPDRLAAGRMPWATAGVAQLALASRVVTAARRWDAMVSHWLLPSSLAAALVSRGRPHLAVAHSSDVHLAVRLGIARPLARVLCVRGTRFAFTSRSLLDRFTAAAGSAGAEVRARAIVQPMGCDAQIAPASAATRVASRRRFGLGDGRLVVLCLARLVPVKGLDLLIEAAARAQPVTLLIGGDGPERGPLAARIARLGIDARLLGELRGDDKTGAFAAADVFALASRPLADGRTEGAPVAVTEALAAGLPVVATSAGGLPELVSDGVDGLVVPPEDTGALAAALARVQNSAFRARLADGARRSGAERRCERVAARLLAQLLASDFPPD